MKSRRQNKRRHTVTNPAFIIFVFQTLVNSMEIPGKLMWKPYKQTTTVTNFLYVNVIDANIRKLN